MERLNAVEDTLAGRDVRRHPGYVTDVIVVAGSDLPVAEVRARVAERIAYAPRFRQVPVPGVAGRLWADDAGFHLPSHVVQLALPERATIRQLQRRVGELQHEPLPADHPGWQIAVVGNLSNHRSAIVSRVNAAWVDGETGVHLLQELLDDTPVNEPPRPAPWEPSPAPSPVDELRAGVVDTIGAAEPSLEGVGKLFGRATGLAARLGAVGAKGLGEMFDRLAEPAPARAAHISGTGCPEATLVRVAAGFRCTIHDVIVAMVAGALWRIGERRDLIALAPRPVRAERITGLGFAMTPVSLALPVRLPDPTTRLEAVASLTAVGDSLGNRLAEDELAQWPGYVSASAHAVASRLAAGASHEVLISHVAGPRLARYLGTREVRAAYPVLPLEGSARVAVGVSSYRGQYLFGLTGAAPVDDLAVALIDELQDLARAVPAPDGPPR